MGLGKVGSLVGTLLHETGFQVTGVDFHDRRELPFPTEKMDLSQPGGIRERLKGFEAAVSCLPYYCNLGVASAAHELGIHYFDLTEDVGTTKAIMQMSDTAKAVLAPQCGLAPGFIAIVGAALAENFRRIRSIKLRVGALPQHPTGLLGYAFNWSPEGVVNEYLNDCEVIEDGENKWVSPLEWVETIVIQGVQLEAFTTSGGLGTMCETYKGRVENLDYKTIRYPGHAKLMNFFFHELLMRKDRKREPARSWSTPNRRSPKTWSIFTLRWRDGKGRLSPAMNLSEPTTRKKSPAANGGRSPGPPPLRSAPWWKWSATGPCPPRGS